jgi:hypothetical protein
MEVVQNIIVIVQRAGSVWVQDVRCRRRKGIGQPMISPEMKLTVDLTAESVVFVEAAKGVSSILHPLSSCPLSQYLSHLIPALQEWRMKSAV